MHRMMLLAAAMPWTLVCTYALHIRVISNATTQSCLVTRPLIHSHILQRIRLRLVNTPYRNCATLPNATTTRRMIASGLLAAPHDNWFSGKLLLRNNAAAISCSSCLGVARKAALAVCRRREGFIGVATAICNGFVKQD